MSTYRKFARRALGVVGVSGIAFLALGPATAVAAPYPDGGHKTTTNDPGDPGTSVDPATVTKKSQTLPFTGGDVAGLAAIGVGAVAAGTVIVRASRRRVPA